MLLQMLMLAPCAGDLSYTNRFVSISTVFILYYYYSTRFVAKEYQNAPVAMATRLKDNK